MLTWCHGNCTKGYRMQRALHPNTHLPITQWHSNLRTDRAPPVTLSQVSRDSGIIVWPQFDPHREGQLFLLLFSPLFKMKAGFHQETQQVASPPWKGRDQRDEEYLLKYSYDGRLKNKTSLIIISVWVRKCVSVIRSHVLYRGKQIDSKLVTTLSHIRAKCYSLPRQSKLKYIYHHMITI